MFGGKSDDKPKSSLFDAPQLENPEPIGKKSLFDPAVGDSRTTQKKKKKSVQKKDKVFDNKTKNKQKLTAFSPEPDSPPEEPSSEVIEEPSFESWVPFDPFAKK